MNIKKDLKRLKAYIRAFPLFIGIISNMRMESSVLVADNKNGTYTITKPVKIGGVTLDNIVFSGGVKIGNINLASLVGKVLEVEKQDNIYVIKGFYGQE